MRVQGDVYCVRVNELPAGCKRIASEKGCYVLAKGEATGHAHIITDEKAVMYEKKGVLYLSVMGLTDVKHEEHGPIQLDTGTWKIGIIKEYDAFEEEARNVKD